jgi:hypothetical protein
MMQNSGSSSNSNPSSLPSKRPASALADLSRLDSLLLNNSANAWNEQIQIKRTYDLLGPFIKKAGIQLAKLSLAREKLAKQILTLTDAINGGQIPQHIIRSIKISDKNVVL